jgi:hypothetical protein
MQSIELQWISKNYLYKSNVHLTLKLLWAKCVSNQVDFKYLINKHDVSTTQVSGTGGALFSLFCDEWWWSTPLLMQTLSSQSILDQVSKW